MDKNLIIAAWAEVMPNSCAHSGVILGGAFFKFRLAANASEVVNGIWENDHLQYIAHIDEAGDFVETSLYITVRPKEKWLAYSSEKMRKQTIKAPTHDKLVSRFRKVRDFIMSHKDDFINLQFDINTK